MTDAIVVLKACIMHLHFIIIVNKSFISLSLPGIRFAAEAHSIPDFDHVGEALQHQPSVPAIPVRVAGCLGQHWCT